MQFWNCPFPLLLLVAWVDKLQLDSWYKTGGNVIIETLTKNLRIIMIASKNVTNSKQVGMFIYIYI